MVYFIIICTIILTDRLSKAYIEKNFKLFQQKEIIKNRLYINHIKNKGGAYGIFEAHSKLLLIVNTAAACIMSSILFVMTVKNKGDILLKLIFSFIIGGAFGNIIDRIKNGSVTDFIYFKLKKAPVFNIADLFITASVFLAVLRLLFAGED